MNSVALIGRLGKDPEMQYTPEGKAVTRFSIAVNRFGRDDPDWFDCVCFDRVAETVAEHMTKGQQVGVSGRLQQDKWQTDGGENRSRIMVIAVQVDFLTKKGDSGDA